MAVQIRIAMWSGPRNISTALMRSWGNRPDTVVCDEPLYAHYLRKTGRIHPGREETLASQESDWQKVVQSLIGVIPSGKSIFYQKHMAHHLLPDIHREWLDQLTNCFLIREPREMLTSLIKKVPDAQLPDTGLPQQLEIFHQEQARTGRVPVVVDSQDLLQDPPRMLAQVTAAIGVPFLPAMLAWPPGRRPTDGAWAAYWYAEVEKSTTFAPFRRKAEEVPTAFRRLLNDCERLYEQLAEHRIRLDRPCD